MDKWYLLVWFGVRLVSTTIIGKKNLATLQKRKAIHASNLRKEESSFALLGPLARPSHTCDLLGRVHVRLPFPTWLLPRPRPPLPPCPPRASWAPTLPASGTRQTKVASVRGRRRDDAVQAAQGRHEAAKRSRKRKNAQNGW